MRIWGLVSHRIEKYHSWIIMKIHGHPLPFLSHPFLQTFNSSRQLWLWTTSISIWQQTSPWRFFSNLTLLFTQTSFQFLVDTILLSTAHTRTKKKEKREREWGSPGLDASYSLESTCIGFGLDVGFTSTCRQPRSTWPFQTQPVCKPQTTPPSRATIAQNNKKENRKKEDAQGDSLMNFPLTGAVVVG